MTPTSSTRTVAQYLAGLPADRRAELARVRAVIRRRLPTGYREAINWGMICYEVPLSRFGDTYNGQPLLLAGLAAQKSYNALYLHLAYQNADRAKRLAAGFKAEGKKLDMGKSCVRFKRAADLALATIGDLVAATPVDLYVHEYARVRPKPAARKKK